MIAKVEENSKASEAGLSGGEVIKKINDFNIKNMDDYEKAIKETGEKETVLLIKSGDYSIFLVI